MLSEVYEYEIYQPVIVTITDFYDYKHNYLTLDSSFGRYFTQNDVNMGLSPQIGYIGLDTDNNGLKVYFDVKLEFNGQPKTIEIKNINTSLSTSTGYMFELSSNIFDKPLPFLDSTSSNINYKQNITFGNGKTLPSGKVTFQLRRISGNNPLPQPIDGLQNPYLINPCISFTIIYKYFGLK